MTIGEKIKRVRMFRKTTQAELGTAVGLGENSQNRIAHYERGTRVPQKELLDRMAEVLDVNRYMLYDLTGQNSSEFLQIMFWLEEANPGIFHLFQLKKYPDEKCNEGDDPGVYYHDTDEWPAHPPVGMWFSGGMINDFMQEWLIRMEEKRAGLITNEEYFEWKLNWPDTCDDGGKREPKKQWRKEQR